MNMRTDPRPIRDAYADINPALLPRPAITIQLRAPGLDIEPTLPLSDSQALAARKHAEYIVRIRSLIRDQPNVDPDSPWLDTQADVGLSGAEAAELSEAKEYLQLFGLLEQHPTRPFWVRIQPSPCVQFAQGEHA